MHCISCSNLKNYIQGNFLNILISFLKCIMRIFEFFCHVIFKRIIELHFNVNNNKKNYFSCTTFLDFKFSLIVATFFNTTPMK